MRTIKSFAAFIFLLSILFVTNLSAQDGKLGIVGKLFSKGEADKLFGKVIGSVAISVADLEEALAKGKDYILITIKDNQVVIRDEERKFLSKERVIMDKKEPLYIYSKHMIQNLLRVPKKQTNSSKISGAAMSATIDAVTVEVRAEVISLTYNDVTLEQSVPCPPFCPTI